MNTRTQISVRIQITVSNSNTPPPIRAQLNAFNVLNKINRLFLLQNLIYVEFKPPVAQKCEFFWYKEKKSFAYDRLGLWIK